MKRAIISWFLCLVFVPSPLPAIAQGGVVVPLAAPPTRVSKTLAVSAATEQLIEFKSLVIDGNGGLVVPQVATLLFFDRTGRRVAAVGRTGEGPGEFNEIGRLGWVGDTLWATDMFDNRVALFSPTGRFLRSFRPTASETALPRSLTGAGHRRVSSFSVSGLSSGGSIVINAQLVPADGRYFLRTTLSADQPEVLLDLAPPIAGAMVQTRSTPGDRGGTWAVATNPFLHQPLSGVSADGSRVGTARIEMIDDRRGRVWVKIVAVSGSTILDRAYSFDGFPITARTLDSLVTAQLGHRTNQTAATLRGLETQLRSQTPKVRPPVLAMRLTRDGSTWLELQPVDETRSWLRINSRGDPVQMISLPVNARLEEYDGTTLWVSETDDVDLRSIFRYTLQPSR